MGIRTFEIMHQDKRVATVREDGSCTVCLPQFMPFNLQLKDLSHFYFWCATRLLTLDRKNAKDFLISHGIQQAGTDENLAEIALACHGLCLTDAYWIREAEENISYADINLFDNATSDEYVDVVLRDRGMIVRNVGLVPSGSALSEKDYMPNVWVRRNGHILLLKNGNSDEVGAELLASRIARCFDADQVLYEPDDFESRCVSRSELLITKGKSIVFVGDMLPYLGRIGKDPWQLVFEQDPYGFHMMNIIDYLIGNTDRHMRNWGFWVGNDSNTPEKLFPLMDFNRSCRSYDSIEGDQCFTTKEKMTQKEAAIYGVKAIGLNQIKALPDDLGAFFSKLNSLRGKRLDQMFLARLEVLSLS